MHHPRMLQVGLLQALWMLVRGGGTGRAVMRLLEGQEHGGIQFRREPVLRVHVHVYVFFGRPSLRAAATPGTVCWGPHSFFCAAEDTDIANEPSIQLFLSRGFSEGLLPLQFIAGRGTSKDPIQVRPSPSLIVRPCFTRGVVTRLASGHRQRLYPPQPGRIPGVCPPRSPCLLSEPSRRPSPAARWLGSSDSVPPLLRCPRLG